MLNTFYVDSIIKTAIEEDINYIDVSADMLIPSEQRNDSYFVAKDDGVLCGLDFAMRVFTLLDSTFTFTAFKKDGDRVNKGDIIVEFNGKTRELLKGERTALNIIQHMSGIATATNRAVELCKGTSASVADTRKTLPGLRAMQKYAVACGGGRNHRFNLSDGAMLKDNHIDACGGIIPAVKALRSKLGHMVKIEVETRNFEEVKQAVEAGADVIMLDNMNCEQMAEAVKIIDGKALTEASGNITLQNIAEVAKTGVDIISLGALTHSVKAFDISMKMK
ncbi:MAG: carboxylating nicotinate-nucleotide diphosphorylase [Oscillospiraceae bacterium]|nr:carboxylating nicotinate-nucleotide diphosphorylase [Oscillospiraceae bacterium]